MRALLALLLCACVSPPHEEPAAVSEPFPLGTATMAAALAQTPMPIEHEAAALMPRAAALSSLATYTLRYAPTNCVMPIYQHPGEPPTQDTLPFLSCRGVGPTTGQPWVLDCWTKADVHASDNRAAWLVVGWQDFAPVDYSSWGMPGCWLLVQPTLVVYLPVGIDDGLVSRAAASSGRMELHWTPPPSAASQTLWFQPLVAAPGVNQFGLVGGPALRVTVGS